MLKEAYNQGALAACVEAGLVKEAGTAKDVARVFLKSLKERAKSVGKGVRDASAKLRSAEAASTTPTVGKKFVEGYKGAVPKLRPHSPVPPADIEALEKTLLERATPWLIGGGAGLGALGAGYGAYEGSKAIWPHAFED